MLLNLHIIGVQKAGTTALASFLHQHPSIYVVAGKEAHVFDHPLYSEQSDKIAFANTIYKSKLKNYQDQPIVCDATPITVFRLEFMQACQLYNPNARFILILRDPVERAISHYRMSRSRGQEKRSMLVAFLMEPFRLNGMNRSNSWSFDSSFRNHSYLSRGLYSKQLRKVYNTVPKKQLLVLRQEELQHHHRQVMVKIFDFLDITSHNITPSQIFASQKVTAYRSDILAKLYAQLYFFIHKETPKQWDKVINS